ncbi:hypothetical protein BP5796_10170 [Coleophoma crateriformis]|uniref:Tachykinin family protein n=1 Tax=Coleophoma crateriformis TaxID=565419 RepID=A0A3D8QUV3_9HELO|nr:hypothetical protein BP5796_10170 [Coleophoma crateriformis]
MANDQELNQNLEFLTFTPSRTGDKETRRIVRSHAIRDAVRKRKAGHKEAVRDTAVNSPAAHKGRFRLDSAKLQRPKKGILKGSKEPKTQLALSGLRNGRGGKYDASLQPSPTPFIQQPAATWKADPFETLPIKCSIKQRALTLYHQNVFKTNSFAFNPTEAFVAYAAADPALLNATLSLLTLYNDLSMGHEVSQEALLHRGEALRIVNERLRWSPAEISDGTIGAVANLAHFEIMNGLFENALTHFNGLSHMVSTRGGLLALGSNELVQKSVGWADISFSSSFHHALQYPLLGNRVCDGRLSEFVLHTRHRYLPASYISPTKHLGTDVEQVFLALAICSTILDLGEKASDEDKEQFSRGSYIAGYRLSCLPNQSDEVVGADFIRKIARVATLLYLHLALKEIPKTSQVNKHLTSQLYTFLDPLEITPSTLSPILNNSNSNDAQLIVWNLFMGASAARGVHGMENFFVQLLADALNQLGVRDIQQFRKILASVLWIDGWCSGESLGVWRLIEDVTRSGGVTEIL